MQNAIDEVQYRRMLLSLQKTDPQIYSDEIIEGLSLGKNHGRILDMGEGSVFFGLLSKSPPLMVKSPPLMVKSRP